MKLYEVICYCESTMDEPQVVNHTEVFTDLDMAIAYADYWELNMLEQHPEIRDMYPEDGFDTWQHCRDGIAKGEWDFAADFTRVGVRELRETVEDLAEIAELC